MKTVNFIYGKYGKDDKSELELLVLKDFLDSLIKNNEAYLLCPYDKVEIVDRLKIILERDSFYNAISIKDILDNCKRTQAFSEMINEIKELKNSKIYIIRPDIMFLYNEKDLVKELMKNNCESEIAVMETV